MGSRRGPHGVEQSMRFGPEFLDELRARISLAEVVGKRVALKKRGRNFLGLCPFHREKTPSFNVHDDKGFYHCFGCQTHGDVIDFVMRTENVTFPEAVEKIAGLAGMKLPAPSPREAERDRETRSLNQVLEAAAHWFAEQLKSPAGSAARKYLEDRGLTEAQISRFRLGFAPEKRGALKAALVAQGFPEKMLIDSGLVIVPDEGGDSFDRFRGRVMFPITDRRGPGDRLRRAGDGRHQAEIPQLAGDRALSQRPGALQPGQRLAGRPRRRRDHRRRRLYGRDRAGSGGIPERGRTLGHRPYRRSDDGAVAGCRRADALLRRRRRGRYGRRGRRPSAPSRCSSPATPCALPCCRRGKTRTVSFGKKGPRRSPGFSKRPRPWRGCCGPWRRRGRPSIPRNGGPSFARPWKNSPAASKIPAFATNTAAISSAAATSCSGRCRWRDPGPSIEGPHRASDPRPSRFRPAPWAQHGPQHGPRPRHQGSHRCRRNPAKNLAGGGDQSPGPPGRNR